MKESYFMSFIGGSSGRFLSGIFWEIKENNKIITEKIPLNKYNSAHNVFNFWQGAINGGGWQQSVFENLKFTYDNSTGMGYSFSHYYPDWQKIENNPEFNTTKFIIIGLDIDDIKEIHVNGFIKNDLDLSEQLANSNKDNIRLPDVFYSAYCDAYGHVNQEGFYQEISDSGNNNRIKHLLNNGINDILTTLDSKEENHYINLHIPESFVNRVTIIKYKDIYTTSENGVPIALEKLSTLAKRKPNDVVIKKYKEYLEGRLKLLDDYRALFV